MSAAAPKPEPEPDVPFESCPKITPIQETVQPVDHPSDPEAQLLSACLIDGGETLGACILANLRVESFKDIRNRLIYSHLLELHKSGTPIEQATLYQSAKAGGDWEQITGDHFVEITRSAPTTLGAKVFLRSVQDSHALRETESILAKTREEIRAGVPIEEILTGLDGRFKWLKSLSTKPSAPTFEVWGPDQFLGYQPPPDANIVGDHILDRGKWTSLLGVGGLGKTRLALWMARCQIVGQEWCGLQVSPTPLRWLILSTENGLSRWKSDLSAMKSTLSELEWGLVRENLRILALTDDAESDLNTGNPAAMDRLTQTLQSMPHDVIVLDPFVDMIDGDENKTEDVIATLRTLRRIIRKQNPAAAVLLIHHSRTGAANIIQAGDNFNAGNFGRGAKAIYGVVRAEIQLAPGKRDKPEFLVMACGKNSDGPKFKMRGLIFDPETCAYDLDPDWEESRWREDASGEHTSKSCSIADAVAAVTELTTSSGGEAKTADIVSRMVEISAASTRTCKSRIADAFQGGYLRKGERAGWWRLGAKPVSEAR